MFEEANRVRERRRERKEKILMQTRDSMMPYTNDLHDPTDDRFSSYTPQSLIDDEPPHMPPREVLGLQVFASLVLVGVTYLMFQTQVSLPASWKEVTREVLTRDFNFEGVAYWYQDQFGHSPSILPALNQKQTTVPATTTLDNSTQWVAPSDWAVVKAYDVASAKLVLDTGQEGEVISGQTGWIVSVGEKPGFGMTVIVKYPQGREVWYGNFEKVLVAPNDWINQGEVVGKAKLFNETSRYLFMAMKQKGTFINPMDVITFD